MTSIRSIDQNHLYQNIVEEIEKINIFRVSGKSDILLSGKGFTSDAVQRFIYYKNSNFYNNIFKPLLCDAIFRAESKSEGAGEICLNMTLEKIVEGLRRIQLGAHIKDIECDIENDLNDTLSQSRDRIINPSNNDIDLLLREFLSLDSHLEIFDILLRYGISTSPVIIEKGNKRETVIDITSGFTFNIGANPDCLSNNKAWKRKNVSCLVIDGIIESIGEIHHLLERASKDKNAYILFVRGLSEEVSQTISLNLSRGTIDVMPICVGFYENTLNILNDIAVCTNSHLVSSYTGDLISTAAKGPFSLIRDVEVSENKLSLLSSPDRDKINSHLKYLNRKKDDTQALAVRELISNRIRSMTEGKIVLTVGTDLIREEPTTIELFDKCLRSISAAMKEGLIYDDNLDIFKYTADRKIIPSLSAYFGLLFSKSCTRSILSTGHCLISDD